MDIPQVCLLEPGDVSVELITTMVARCGLVAAHGILPFLLRLIDLTQLLPYLRLLLITQEALHARMDPLQLSIAMPGWRADRVIRFAWVTNVCHMTRR